ncbi:MAG: hypothetical protein CVU56_25180 [Deltaproteobacteria bacterium HGW-Deltaproteobacteria-14]|nr:MAG: hypothetical protein CVU56_25180 [Deltaproteobacteria bacterium HGW-Deltaproteobacteria-14]
MGLDPRRAAQFKFEVEDRLRRYYQNPGRPVRFVIGLAHRATLARTGLPDVLDWPALAGYVATIRDVGSDLAALPRERDTKQYLERVVAEAIDAEFAAYVVLPAISPAALERWLVPDGPALRGVMHVLVRHRERGWILTNPFNPSTKRLMSAKVKDLAATSATVGTTEYFYLRWWDTRREKYAYAYRELNRQTYVLERGQDGLWRVLDNLRAAPRATPSNRRVRQPERVEGTVARDDDDR